MSDETRKILQHRAAELERQREAYGIGWERARPAAAGELRGLRDTLEQKG